MKIQIPVLLCPALALLLLSACQTTPSENSAVLRRNKLIEAEAQPAPAPAPTPAITPAPVVVVTPATPAPVVTPAAPVVVVSPPVTPAAPVVVLPPPAPVLAPGTLQTKRSGATVRVTWALPESASGFRAIEIMRNTQEQPSGRTRIRALRASVTEIEDIVPDVQANYWYWLKVTHTDGTIQNCGPFTSPPQS